jgi:uncharacterized protein
LKIAAHFAPNEAIARGLLPETSGPADDASHDPPHVLGVWRNVQTLTENESGDKSVLTPATLLHDCAYVPKNDPKRASASRLSAEKASGILMQLGWTQIKVAMVAHAI